MRQLIGLIIINLFFSTFTWGTTSIRMFEANEPKVYYKSESIKFLTETNGDGSTHDKAFDIYVPIDNGGNADYTKYTPKTDLPKITDAGNDLFFYVDIENTDDTSTRQVYIAIEQSETSYKISSLASPNVSLPDFAGDTVTVGSHTNMKIQLSMLTDICFDSSTFDCTNLGATPTVANKKFYIFMFSGIPSTTFNPSDSGYDNGLFIDVYMSNTIRDNSQIGLRISDLFRGDQSLYIDYTTVLSDATMIELLIVNKAAASTVEQEYQLALAAGAELLSEENEYPATEGASIQIGNLVNGNTYFLSIGFMDKYGFVSKLTPTRTGRPEEIAAFLKSQQCYLLSAGFQREHYIIDFFKMIRDELLLKVSFGKKLVSLYYSTAPKYTKAIYESENLSLFIRSLAYFLYFMIKFLMPVFFLIIIGHLIFKSRGKLLSKVGSKSLTR